MKSDAMFMDAYETWTMNRSWKTSLKRRFDELDRFTRASRIPNDARSSIVEQCGEPLGFRTCRSEPPAFSAWKAPLTSQLLRAVASERVGFSKGLPGGDCRGLLGLSGAKNPTSNAQGVGRQRAPRAAEFVSKNTKPPGGFDKY